MSKSRGEAERSRARKQLERLWAEHKGICQYCFKPTTLVVNGRKPQFYTADSPYPKDNYEYPLATRDHVVPVSKGGKDSLSNMTLACSLCNHKKDDLTLEEFNNIKLWGCDADYLFKLELQLRHGARSLNTIITKDEQGNFISNTVISKTKFSTRLDDTGCVWYKKR